MLAVHASTCILRKTLNISKCITKYTYISKWITFIWFMYSKIQSFPRPCFKKHFSIFPSQYIYLSFRPNTYNSLSLPPLPQCSDVLANVWWRGFYCPTQIAFRNKLRPFLYMFLLIYTKASRVYNMSPRYITKTDE